MKNLFFLFCIFVGCSFVLNFESKSNNISCFRPDITAFDTLNLEQFIADFQSLEPFGAKSFIVDKDDAKLKEVPSLWNGKLFIISRLPNLELLNKCELEKIKFLLKGKRILVDSQPKYAGGIVDTVLGDGILGLVSSIYNPNADGMTIFPVYGQEFFQNFISKFKPSPKNYLKSVKDRYKILTIINDVYNKNKIIYDNAFDIKNKLKPIILIKVIGDLPYHEVTLHEHQHILDQDLYLHLVSKLNEINLQYGLEVNTDVENFILFLLEFRAYWVGGHAGSFSIERIFSYIKKLYDSVKLVLVKNKANNKSLKSLCTLISESSGLDGDLHMKKFMSYFESCDE